MMWLWVLALGCVCVCGEVKALPNWPEYKRNALVATIALVVMAIVLVLFLWRGLMQDAKNKANETKKQK
jgi:membrane protein YdbS with pleckstrin-like domain